MQTALITGAARGIGRALAQVHLELGHQVILIDKDTEQLALESAQWDALYPNQVQSIACDISQQKEVNLLATHKACHPGPIHYLYNNAGIMGELAPVWALDAERLHQVMEINLYGMLYVIQAFMPKLLQQTQDTHIINIASLYALCSGSHMAAYAMSKHAVLALTEALYFDLKQLDKPIHVALAFPSFTDTALLSTQKNSPFQTALQPLLTHSRPALEVAKHLVDAVQKKQHYIFPDREVKNYCEQRTQAIIQQEAPHYHSLEKIISTLIKRKVET